MRSALWVLLGLIAWLTINSQLMEWRLETIEQRVNELRGHLNGPATEVSIDNNRLEHK